MKTIAIEGFERTWDYDLIIVVLVVISAHLHINVKCAKFFKKNIRIIW